MPKLPLEGIRVVEITVVWAGPFACMMLGDLGAEVIRVESIQHFPSSTRGLMLKIPPSAMKAGSYYHRQYLDSEVGRRPWDRFAYFNRTARNKLSCCLDLRQPQGINVFRRLVQVSDVFYENNAVGVMEKLGITYAVLSQWNPRVIFVSNPGFGNTGPYKDYLGFGVNIEAVTGHTWLRGYDDQDHPLNNTAVYHMDAAGGAAGVFAVLTALHHRNRTGKGLYIDMAGAETAIPHFGEAIMDYVMNRRVQRTVGNRDIHGAAPCGCYRCRGGPDEWVCITITSDEEWRAFCQAIGSPAWAFEERFADVLGRLRHQDDLDRLIQEWTSRHDKYEVMVILQEAGVPAGPVIGDKDAHRDPQLISRHFFEVVNQRETGVHIYPGFLWKYSKTPMRVRRPPVCLGEHNEYVFRELLHMAEDERADLEAKQIIGGDAYLDYYR